MRTFQGAYTALITPFTSDGSTVELERLADNIRHQAAGGVAGVVPCGTTGESPTLSDTEHREVVLKSVEVAGSLGLAVIAGAGSNSTRHAIELNRLAHAAGAHASLQVVPYYNKPSTEGLYRHFMEIAESCPLPIVLYNIPARTGVSMSAGLIERLAAHPNIRAIKEASGSLDLASEITRRTDLALLSGDDTLTLPLASVGAVGVISVAANVVPQKIAELWRLIDAGDGSAAHALHGSLFPLAQGLLSLATNPVAVKTAMHLLGRDSGALRLPLCRPDPATGEAIGRLLAASGLRPVELVA